MKKLIGPIIVIIIIIVIGVIFITKNNEEKEIKNYVNSNYQELENIALSYLNNSEENYNDYIKYIEIDNDLVEFYVKDNLGFYYSKEDIPKAIKDNTELIELGGNKYTWNNGTIIKIRDNWYYFKLKK